jgi:hypothetical protein
MENIPLLSDLGQYDVSGGAGQTEGIRWDLYDSAAYPTTGLQQIQFFQTPLGQNGKTFADTDMVTAGALPSPQKFLITDIRLGFYPGVQPSSLGAPAADSFINDTYKWWTSPAWLELFIASKPYLDLSPLILFPPGNGMSGFAAASDTTTAGAGQQTLIGYTQASGPVFEMQPPLLLTANTNFKVTLNWPALVTIGTQAKVFCHLGGYLYRQTQ